VLELFKERGAKGFTDNELFAAWREAFPDRPKPDGTLRARRVGLAWCGSGHALKCCPKNYPSGCVDMLIYKTIKTARKGGAVWRIR
jgi:hypothetical protein